MLDHESDGALLRRMCAPHPAEARDAWSEFYKRHYEYLYRVCEHTYTVQIGAGRVGELVQDTFIRAFEKACSFRDNGDVDSEGQRKMVRAWLGRISENVVADYFRHEPWVNFIEDPGSVVDVAQTTQAPLVSESQTAELPPSLFESALDMLSEREQHVLRVTAFWYKPGETHQRLPNKVMEELAKSLGTNPANIRQIRVRAMAKVKHFVESQNDKTCV